MRWERGKWIDEGDVKPPYVSWLAEDTDGTVWAGLSTGVLRFEVTQAGVRDAKWESLSGKDGLPRGSFYVSVVDGQLFANPRNNAGMFRWENAARRFVRDDLFFCP